MRLAIKNILSFCLPLLLLTLLYVSCKKQDSTYSEFTKGGEIVYVGKADSLKVYPGNERIKISWLLMSDPSVKKAKVYWNNRSDSLEMDIVRTEQIDTVFVTIDNLKEGGYTFEVFTYDAENNVSVSAEVFGYVYGDNFASMLLGRAIDNSVKEGNNLLLNWRYSEENLTKTEVKYLDRTGKEKLLNVLPTDDETLLTEWKSGSLVEVRSFYIPDSAAIDTFSTAFKKLKIMRDPPPGGIYDGFPETFEDVGSKSTYSAAEVEIGSGLWMFDYFQIGKAGADRKNGNRSARSYQGQAKDGTPRTTYLEMRYDLPYGASMISFYHAITSSDDPSSFKVQVSKDGGPWEDITDVLFNTEIVLQYKEIPLNIDGPVRFRFYKLSSAEAGREEGRMNIDDISIFSSLNE